MKKNFLFSVLCLLLISFSFNVNAQVRNQTFACGAAEVEIVIDNIIWNATPTDMDAYENTTSDGGFGGRVDDEVEVPVYPPVFHIAELSFNRPVNFGQLVEWTTFFSIDVLISTANYDTDVPVYLVFADDLNAAVTPIGGGTGFRVFPGGLGGGVSSTIAVMGRSAAYEPDDNWDCIEIVAPYRVGKLNSGFICHMDSEIYDNCDPVAINVNHPDTRLATTDAANVDIYPNPVQDNLFVVNNGLDINELSIMTLDGQIINHKTSIRKGIDRTQINTSQLDTGIYLLKLTTSTGIIVKKIIVQ